MCRASSKPARLSRLRAADSGRCSSRRRPSSCCLTISSRSASAVGRLMDQLGFIRRAGVPLFGHVHPANRNGEGSRTRHERQAAAGTAPEGQSRRNLLPIRCLRARMPGHKSGNRQEANPNRSLRNDLPSQGTMSLPPDEANGVSCFHPISRCAKALPLTLPESSGPIMTSETTSRMSRRFRSPAVAFGKEERSEQIHRVAECTDVATSSSCCWQGQTTQAAVVATSIDGS